MVIRLPPLPVFIICREYPINLGPRKEALAKAKSGRTGEGKEGLVIITHGEINAFSLAAGQLTHPLLRLRQREPPPLDTMFKPHPPIRCPRQ